MPKERTVGKDLVFQILKFIRKLYELRHYSICVKMKDKYSKTETKILMRCTGIWTI